MEKVLIKHLDDYDSSEIEAFVSEAIKALGVKKHPRAFIKPNLVHATRYGEHAYTHPEIMRGVFRSFKGNGAEDLILFEDCGLMVPLRYSYRNSGYASLCSKEGVRFLNLAEALFDVRVPVPGGKVHTTLPLPSILIRDGIRVFVPKLKIHAQTSISASLKLLIGLIKRSIRLQGHHYSLDHKIVDAVAAFPPDLVIIDGITLAVNGAGCPDPYPLGVLIASRNAVSADAVAAHLLGFDPTKIKHLRLASERGLGPCEIDDILVISDKKVKPLPKGTFAESRIDEIHPGIRYFEGKVHNDRRCRGGCIGFVAESAHYLNHHHAWRTKEKVSLPAKLLFGILGQNPRQERPREIGVVVGDYKGEIPKRLRKSLVFVGDCARAGQLKPRAHLKGCPVFMNRMVYGFAKQGRFLNPYLDVIEGIPFVKDFFTEQFMKAYNIITYPLRRFL
ncbi:DUF362 domain-containing protein [candidate division WOR-3 bacterium]|nr:DUF362 domain-containing protein [candidate division WOR-3 bacterium]